MGGPTANFRAAGVRQADDKRCLSAQAVSVPKALPELKGRSFRLSETASETAGASKCEESIHPFGYPFRLSDLRIMTAHFLRELCEHHVSGQLKVAPEHISDAVLEKMGKPESGVFTASL